MKIINSGEIKSVHVLLGFGAGYGTYLNTDNLVYALIVGVVFSFLLSSIKSKRKQSKK